MKQKFKKPTTVFIDKEYLDLVPRPTDEQYDTLKQSIKESGLLNPIIVSSEGKVLDGHTRFKICSELNIIPSYEVKKFENINDERKYIITANLKRRHFNPFQIVEVSQTLRRMLNQKLKKETNEKISLIRKGKAKKASRKERSEHTTRYKLGKITNLGISIVDRANYVIDHGTKQELERVRSGKVSLEYIYKSIRNRLHADPTTLKRNSGVFPPCENCKSETRFVGKCHVHKKYCCTKCEWGE